MTDDGQLRLWLGAHRAVVTGGSPIDHLDVDTLSRHATAQLSPGKARIVSEHLMVCEDGRCLAFVRSCAEDVDAAAALLYPEGELEGMHARTFLCREALWEQFEDMAREQGAPIDDLLSEAMRSYARQRSQQNMQEAPTEHASSGPYDVPSYPPQNAHDYEADRDDELARTGMIRQPPQYQLSGPPTRNPPSPVHSRPQSAPPPRLTPPPPRMPVQRPFTAPLGHGLPAPPPPPPGRSGAVRHPTGGGPVPPPSRSMGPQPRPTPSPLSAQVPPNMSGTAQMSGAAMSSTASVGSYGGAARRAATFLTVTYRNRSIDVTKERFVLGRSKTQADLVLDDANVSRQHAAIERVGETWMLTDLGSTNGCFVEGQRVTQRPIADGDVIEITTHQIRCTLR